MGTQKTQWKLHDEIIEGEVVEEIVKWNPRRIPKLESVLAAAERERAAAQASKRAAEEAERIEQAQYKERLRNQTAAERAKRAKMKAEEAEQSRTQRLVNLAAFLVTLVLAAGLVAFMAAKF